MSERMFEKEAIFLDVEGESIDDVLDYMFTQLYREGYVTQEFQEAVKAREHRYPTGLPGTHCDIAVPHTDPQYVVRPFIAVARTTSPIPFVQMGTRDETLRVRLVFLLGFKTGSYQVTLLRVLIKKLIEEGTITPYLLRAESVDEMYQLVSSIEESIPAEIKTV